MRTLVDIPEANIKALDEIAQRQKVSRAQVIRRAVDEHLKKFRPGARGDLKPYFGLLKDLGIDGLEYQRRVRSEW